MIKRNLFCIIIFIIQVYNIQANNSFKLINNDKGAGIHYKGQEAVVKTAINMLIQDSKLICKDPFSIVDDIQDNTIIIGIPDKDSHIKKIVEEYKIDISDLSGKWEAFKIVKASKDGNNYLLTLGSDPRGTAYGILELSRYMGISPWVWWADVIPNKKTDIEYTPDEKVHAPSVQYRGIFLNDEDWALMPWSTRTFEPTARRGAIGPKTYERIFELLLRLRANTIWPAMHECTVPFFFVEGNKEIADKYGIVVSNSHAEPMMRTNTGEWDSKERGTFNFLTNEKQILSYWDERAKELNGFENIYTVGMRGIHDGRMQGVESIDDETKVLHLVIDEQRKILSRNNPGKRLPDIPQQFVPYKEVLKAYDNGLKLPEDITLVWCDDNHGNIMRLSNPQEQKRSGGAGVYYHISYWGKPHDYLWLASTQPGLIYSEMKRAWNNGARRLWILNVGDIKPGEYLTEFFLDMAWDINSVSGNTIYSHQQNWIKNTFGNIASDEISHIMKQYYLLAGQRKPDHMGWNKVEDWSGEYTGPGLQPIKDSELSPFYFGDEINKRIEAYDEIAFLSQKLIKDSIPDYLKPAYFQLIYYPVAASAAMNRKILYAQKARLYAQYNLPVAEEYAHKAIEAYNEITALDYTYNKDMLNGKWELMMDMKPRDLPVFQQPVLPAFSDNYLGVETDVAIWIENQTEPMTGDKILLPEYSGNKRETYQLGIHSKTKHPLIWEVIDKPDFFDIKEENKDRFSFEKTLSVTASDQISESGSFKLKINGKVFSVEYKTENFLVNRSQYAEQNKMIALNGFHYTNNIQIEHIEGLGHSGNAVRLPAIKKISEKATHLSYKIITKSSGNMQIKVGTIPKHPVNKSDIRYAIVIDNQKPQIVSSAAGFLSPKWSENVLRNQSLTITDAFIQNPGEHIIKIYALDEDILLDQIMFEFNKERKHYLIPAK